MSLDFEKVLRELLTEHIEKCASEGIEADDQDAVNYFSDILLQAILDHALEEGGEEPDGDCD